MNGYFIIFHVKGSGECGIGCGWIYLPGNTHLKRVPIYVTPVPSPMAWKETPFSTYRIISAYTPSLKHHYSSLFCGPHFHQNCLWIKSNKFADSSTISSKSIIWCALQSTNEWALCHLQEEGIWQVMKPLVGSMWLPDCQRISSLILHHLNFLDFLSRQS